MEPHVLSVQSHVARDYVGNRAGSLALQLLGHEVDIINTVNYSSMYVHQGNTLSVTDFEAIWDGLVKAIMQPKGAGQVGAAAKHTSLTHHDIPVALSGYIASPEVLVRLSKVVKELKETPCGCSVTEKLRALKGPDCEDQCLYLMDPVMGDNGHLYVSDAMISAFRTAASVADVVTPNEYELEWLLGQERNPKTGSRPTLEEILAKVRQCHNLGPFYVFLTSVGIAELPLPKLVSITSVKRTNSVVPVTVVVIFDRMDCYLGGCGDVTSAVLASRLMEAKLPDNSSESAEELRRIATSVIVTLQNLIEANPKESPSIQLLVNQKMLRDAPVPRRLRSMVTTRDDCAEEILMFLREHSE